MSWKFNNKKLVDLRAESGRSMEELALVCKVGIGTISRIESNQISPRISTIMLLATAFRVHPCDFFVSGEKSSG
ncbi:MAG: helix-turn-helix domain-containing protein [Planctomycetota bacterium]|jgi:transcriptional regulator with XRE-family HTH domain